MRTGCLFEGIKLFQNQIAAMVAQHCEYTKNHLIVPLKMVTFTHTQNQKPPESLI